MDTEALSFSASAEFIYDEIFSKKGRDIVHINVKGYSPITDDFVICSVDSMQQLKSLSSSITRRLSREVGIKSTNTGPTFTDTGWVVLDYFDFMIHLFVEQDREYYNIEQLWNMCEVEKIEAPVAPIDAE